MVLCVDDCALNICSAIFSGVASCPVHSKCVLQYVLQRMLQYVLQCCAAVRDSASPFLVASYPVCEHKNIARY